MKYSNNKHMTEDGVEKKYCGKCEKFKSLTSFGKVYSKWDGLNSRCKECIHSYVNNYNKNNPRKRKGFQYDKFWANFNKMTKELNNNTDDYKKSNENISN
jgi:hypothetical protein